MKIWAIMGGGDWADASVEHLIIPDGINIEDERKKCQDYYLKTNKYYNLPAWLKEKCGAREPSEDELEIYWEGP